MEIKTRKTCQELFNLFSNSVLVENKKNKKNYDECLEVYKTTQLFDFTHVMTYDTTYSAISSNENDKLTFHFLNFEANIPTESIFIKVNEDIQLFLRDYDVNIITGCFLHKLDEVTIAKLPFTIRNNIIKNESKVIFENNIITKKILKEIENKVQNGYSAEILNNLIEPLQILQKMQNQVIFIDEAENPKPRYFNYKDKAKGTLKMMPKPIYIVLDAPKTKKNYKHVNMIKQGKISRCFSFPVIGHWRKLDAGKIGKDKHGNYTINGFTWVKAFIKGNKNMPLIRHENIVL